MMEKANVRICVRLDCRVSTHGPRCQQGEWAGHCLAGWQEDGRADSRVVTATTHHNKGLI